METFEKALDSEEIGEIKSRKSVLLRCDVQLLNAIAGNLVNKHQINIVVKAKFYFWLYSHRLCMLMETTRKCRY